MTNAELVAKADEAASKPMTNARANYIKVVLVVLTLNIFVNLANIITRITYA